MSSIIGKAVEKWSFHLLLIKVYVYRASLENYLAISTKSADMHILRSNNTTLKYIHDGKRRICSLKDIGKKVHMN